MPNNLTIQSNIKNFQHSGNITDYALFLGGLNTTHEALEIYDPLRTGYGRIFMVRQPIFLEQTIKDKLKVFKHIIEYGNVNITGLNDISMDFANYQGGYSNKSFEIPTFATDSTNSITIGVYEFSGSPIREVIYQWMNGTADFLTGLSHYNGLNSGWDGTGDRPKYDHIQANQTAEFIYVATDHTGKSIEYACLLTNCFPKNLKNDHFNYQSGDHDLVKYDIEFTCTKYESIQINKVAQALLNKYKVLSNSLNFYSGFNTSGTIDGGTARGYNPASGKLEESSSRTNTEEPMEIIEAVG